jgi:cellulose synthase/poly-beta-1,6-N-acetylglucosamine synthase-like glycosyltransferase
LSLEQNPSKPIKYAYKKAALNLGLGKAKGEYIVQLDGDVWVGKNYLNFVCASIKNQKSDFIAGPVQLTGPNTLFGNFQILDFMGMMGLTQAGIFSGKWYMANGANMVYKKNLIEFEEDKRASGDDISAIQTIADNHGHVSFMKSEGAIVYTHCVNDLTSFYRQRIRWATKNKFVKNNWMVVVMAIPFLNALLLFSYFPMLWIIPKTYVLLLVLFHLFMHLSVDFLYLKELNKFFKVKKVFKYFFLAKIYNAVYLVVIGSASFFIKKYKWKDRLVE